MEGDALRQRRPDAWERLQGTLHVAQYESIVWCGLGREHHLEVQEAARGVRASGIKGKRCVEGAVKKHQHSHEAPCHNATAIHDVKADWS